MTGAAASGSADAVFHYYHLISIDLSPLSLLSSFRMLFAPRISYVHVLSSASVRYYLQYYISPGFLESLHMLWLITNIMI